MNNKDHSVELKRLREEIMKAIDESLASAFKSAMKEAMEESKSGGEINIPRKKIAIIDAAIAPLMKRRFKLADEIVESKIRRGDPIVDKRQRLTVIERVIEYSNLDQEEYQFARDYREIIERLYYNIINEHEMLQQYMGVKYLRSRESGLTK